MTEPGTLSVALAEPVTTAPEGETSWVEILREGTYKHDIYGEIKITRANLENMKKNFEAGVRGIEVAIDVAHDPDRGAAGWIKRLEIRPSSRDKDKVSLWGEVTWTSFGRELVEGGVYRYISAEFGPWTDPETGEKYEDVLFAATLTNRPFVKGMAPVALSEVVALAKKLWEGLKGVFGTNEEESEMSMEDIEAEWRAACEELGIEPVEGGEEYEFAEWTRAYINDLPDSSFAVIEPAYKRGETDNKNARHLPHHGPGGGGTRNVNLDLPHLRNALARWKLIKPVTDSISTEELRRRAWNHLKNHLSALKTYKQQEVLMTEKLTALLGELGIELEEGADPFEVLKAHITGLKAKLAELEKKISGQETPAEMEETTKALKLAEAKNKELEERVQRLEKELREREKAVYFDEKIREGKLTPAERPYFEELYDKDEETVKKLLDERDPVVDFSEAGTDSAKGAASLSNEDKLDQLARKLMEEKEISYEEALLEVAREHPELAE